MGDEYKIVPASNIRIFTPLYDFVTEITGFGSTLKANALKRAGLEDGESLLDIGCGTGTLVVLAKGKYPHSRVVGIDADEEILRIAQKKAEQHSLKVELVRAGAERLPFDAAMFDVAISTLVFHHLPTDIKKQAAREVYRVLKKGGRFLVADFGKPAGFFLKLSLKLESLLEEVKYVKDNLEGKLPLFLEEAGFQVQEISPRYRGVQFLLATK